MKLSFSRILSHHNCCIFATDFERTCVSTDTKEHKCGEALDDKTPREDNISSIKRRNHALLFQLVFYVSYRKPTGTKEHDSVVLSKIC